MALNDLDHGSEILVGGLGGDFVCALINTAIAGYLVASFSVPGDGTWGSPYIMNYIPLPRFDRETPSHTRITTLSLAAHEAAACNDAVRLCEIEGEVDRLAAELWSLSENELKDIKASLRGLKE